MAMGVIYYGAHYPNPRTLTVDEEAYARIIYADSIDYTVVQVHTQSVYSKFSSLTLGNSIHFKIDNLGKDISSDVTLSPQGRLMLIHELNHVFQYQHDGWDYLKRSFISQLHAYIKTGSRTNAYDWRSRVTEEVPYSEWNPEEQAEALAEFSREQETISTGSNMRDPSILKLGCLIPLLSESYCIENL
jgi:hypothetical protein